MFRLMAEKVDQYPRILRSHENANGRYLRAIQFFLRTADNPQLSRKHQKPYRAPGSELVTQADAGIVGRGLVGGADDGAGWRSVC